MNSVNQLLEEILIDIIPTNQELNLINEVVDKLKFLLEKKAHELGIDFTRIEPQGSTGIKQTQLRNDFDIDLFIGLNYDLYSQKYVGLSKNKLKKVSKKDFLDLCNTWIIKSLALKEFHYPRLLYAEHPYVTVDYIIDNDKLKIDIVLYFDLDSKHIKEKGPITAVDRSPWHGRFIRDNLNRNQKNDVRLLKQFFKACHSYGDKSAVGKIGFIGYSAELLIHHFGTIQKVFENFGKLNELPIDFHGREKKDLLKITHFQNDYLIITDPVDRNRNVASAISEKAYKYCNQRIKDFIKNPNKDFFTIYPIPEQDVSNYDNIILSNIFVIELKNNNKNVHYTINRDKLYSLGEHIKANGEREFSHSERFGKIEFEVYFEDEIDKYNVALYCQKPVISKTYTRKGPPVKEKSHAVKFKKKNPNYIERDNYLWVESQREYTNFLKFVKDIVKNKIQENLEIINISEAFNVKTTSGKRTIYILKNMILPNI
jgi:tRNA nucleotidyltransferase (CCA-adding enzyme)